MSPTPHVVLLGTCDTKLDELLFVRSEIVRNTTTVTFIDVGRKLIDHGTITISQERLLKEYGEGQNVSELPRGDVIKTMAACATKAVKKLYTEGEIHAIISAGGSGGTSLAAQVMRDALPIGFPKLIVSTVASGDTNTIVGETDITLMSSVVDVAGLNQILRQVLSNAGFAIAAMARAQASRRDDASYKEGKKKRVGITMFGVTTPAVDAIRKHLESKYDIETYVFHATGHGGKAMERLVREGGLDAVIDLTTTEICDHHTGGVMSAGPHRLEAASEAGIPSIVSVGATDMTNFGPMQTVPERYKDRKLYEHNPVVTLMRTSKDEARKVGTFIVEKLRKYSKDPKAVQVWLPTGGISMIAVPDGPFADSEADKILFQTIKDGLAGSGIDVIEDKRAINDQSFAHDVAEALVSKMGIIEKQSNVAQG
ncbi:hypothetical protein CC86DRAFT_98784 [Ophiobolus disseminans]|uniref:Uncharacterized protein n=1 Tax=Ophiobolus disseminans TaxID=1469910 RepID=A0A6A6ZL16_9PLEO|nr:hypothetical protein CC86DRAFT_98784 [Ophiobolus disseminans]